MDCPFQHALIELVSWRTGANRHFRLSIALSNQHALKKDAYWPLTSGSPHTSEQRIAAASAPQHRALHATVLRTTERTCAWQISPGDPSDDRDGNKRCRRLLAL